jgi:hypothetical protein
MDKSCRHPGLADSRRAALVPGVAELVARFTSLWNEGGRRRPDLGRTFSSRERSPREKAFSAFVDALGIVLEKGGTSVLADGCLVAGNLTRDQVSFLFGFGALLQLMDDLEDVLEDRKARLWTIFSRAAGNEPLDEATDRTLNFGQCVLAGLDRFSEPGSEPLREIIRPSLPWGVIVSAGRLRRLYRRSYLKELESHSPFRFSFYDRERRRLEHRRAPLARLFESLAQS